MVKRDSYMNRLIHSMWNGEIKVITGIRRCGKSVLLFDLFFEYLLSQNVSEDHILKIELDQRRYYKFRNPITLCEYVESTVRDRKDEKFYLFIDEVQLTTKVVDKENGGIEVTIYDMLNELKAYKNLDVYVTGSNSKGLSKDIATEFRGRATQIHVFPLSFAEFYSAVGLSLIHILAVVSVAAAVVSAVVSVVLDPHAAMDNVIATATVRLINFFITSPP